MALTVWMLLASFLGVAVELIFGNYGFCVPVFASVAFCLIVAQGGRRAFPVLAVIGALLDLSYARAFPTQLVLVPIVAVVAESWRRHGDCRQPLAQILPGSAVGAINGALLVLLVRLPGSSLGWDILWRNGWIILQSAIGGTVLVPCLAALLDAGGKRLGLPLYAKARNRRKN